MHTTDAELGDDFYMESTTPDSLDEWDGDGSGEELDDGLDEIAAGNDCTIVPLHKILN
jgi:hypothetical protein